MKHVYILTILICVLAACSVGQSIYHAHVLRTLQAHLDQAIRAVAAAEARVEFHRETAKMATEVAEEYRALHHAVQRETQR